MATTLDFGPDDAHDIVTPSTANYAATYEEDALIGVGDGGGAWSGSIDVI